MGKASVLAWLSGNGPFEQGVELLKAYGKADRALLFLLSCGETTYSRRRLVSELQDLANHVVADQQQEDARVPAEEDDTAPAVLVTRSGREDGVDVEKLSDELRQVHQDIKRSYKEMAHRHARLELIPTDKERFQEMVRIDELDAFIVKSYARIDAFLESGVDPYAKVEPTPMQLQSELLNNRSYISKNKGNAARAAEVARRKARNLEIQQLLDATAVQS